MCEWQNSHLQVTRTKSCRALFSYDPPKSLYHDAILSPDMKEPDSDWVLSETYSVLRYYKHDMPRSFLEHLYYCYA